MNLNAIKTKSSLAALALICATVAVAAPETGTRSFCNFGGKGSDSVASKSPPSKHAEQCLRQILRVRGMKSAKFVLESADIDVARARILGEHREIYYNDYVLDATKGMQDWAGLGVLSHEVGHHVLGHTLREGVARPEEEGEADEYIGFTLFQLKVPSSQVAARAIDLFANVFETDTHPSAEHRAEKVAEGYRDAEEISKAQLPSTQSVTARAPQVVVKSAGEDSKGTRWKLMREVGGIDGFDFDFPTFGESPFQLRCVFYGDDALYLVTKRDQIISADSDGKLQMVGRKTDPILPELAWMYRRGSEVLGVTPEGEIVSVSDTGALRKVGFVSSVGE